MRKGFVVLLDSTLHSQCIQTVIPQYIIIDIMAHSVFYADFRTFPFLSINLMHLPLAVSIFSLHLYQGGVSINLRYLHSSSGRGALGQCDIHVPRHLPAYLRRFGIDALISLAVASRRARLSVSALTMAA